MKIAIIYSEYPLGGAGKGCEAEKKHLEGRQHTVHIISRKKPCRFPTYLFDSIKEIRKIKPDKIIAHVILPNGLVGVIAGILYGIPVYTWCHGSDIYRPTMWGKILNHIVLKHATKVVALTEHMRRHIWKHHRIKATIIPNAIKTEYTSPHQIKHHDFIYIGRNEPVKGVKYLWEAFARLKKMRPDATVQYVGERWLKHEDAMTHLRHSKCLVLPSLSEGFPQVMLEAMSLFVPVIASDVCGVGEIITDGENGLLVEPANPKQLAKKMNQILEDSVLYDRIQVNGYRTAQHYSEEKVIEKVEVMLND